MDPRCGSEVSGSGSIQMQRSQRLYQHFVTEAAAGLRFSQDTVVDLGPDSVSYSQADFHQLFRPTGALKPSAKKKTQERKLCRLAPGPKGAPPERFRGLLPLLESADHLPLRLQTVELLQDSCRRTRLTAVSSAGHYLKRASGLAKPVHKAAHRNHDQIILDNSSKYHKNLQRWSSPAPQRWTDPDKNSAGSAADSWMAAQCSALDGDHRRAVIQRLLAQLFCQDDQSDAQDQPPDAQLVVSLLTHFSSQTTLVRSLLAEQLNSSEWRSRLLSCNTLSCLKGPINKDVVHKLIHLMCNDQRCSVRLAAAEALMKLGKMQDVHSELRLKLEEGRGLRGRMEALDVISHLKLMTATLLEPLVSCFSDEFTAVRKQACRTAESLLLEEETVVSRLLELMENDPAQEVRLSAIRAVGALGLSSPDVHEALQRCVESDEEAELRLAACRLLQSSGAPSAQLQDFLLQRVDVESSWLVRRTMKEVLRLCGCSLQEERCHAKYMKYISLQVKHLCEWPVLTEKVLLLEDLQDEASPPQGVNQAAESAIQN